VGRPCRSCRALGERAAAIRDYLRDHPNRALVRKYSFVAARYEQMKLQMHEPRATPDEDARFREVSAMLTVLGHRLGLDHGEGFLPGDPQRLISNSWLDCARVWFR
jgi:hypothetical protein